MVVVWILFALLVSLLALLAIPVDLAFSVQRHAGRQHASGTLGWLFGLVRLRLGEPEVRVRTEPVRPKTRRRQRKGKHGSMRRIRAMLRTEGFSSRLLRLGRDLLRRIHLRDLSLNLRLGLDDPADTGRLWAIVGPLAAILTLPPIARVAIEPEFTAEALEVDGKGDIRIVPIQWLFVVLVFMLSPTTLRALNTMRVAAR